MSKFPPGADQALPMSAQVARIFLSSTFRDFGEERDLLVRRVFPALRARLRQRFVELVDVDLRWGITMEQAERGEVLPICLAEIDRSRPWFVGMLGDRYGWVPPADRYDPALIEQQPWLAEHRGGKSVTELEILHGVLNDPKMAGRAFFYFRAQDYALDKGGDYISASDEDSRRLAELKDRIRASGFPVLEDYPEPEDLARRLEEDLWEALDEAFPADQVPDALTREQRRHEAYAAPRRRLYIGGERHQRALAGAMAAGEQRLLVTGPSGTGKSALIANWLEQHRNAHPVDFIHQHYLGATADAADPSNLVRHLAEHIKRVTGRGDALADDPSELFNSLPSWLANASAHAAAQGARWIIVLDGLSGLHDLRDLRWLPDFLPERIHLVVSCLPGEVMEVLQHRGNWREERVTPLAQDECRALLRTYLGHYNKTLTAELEARILAHPMANNPLFLRTLAEELRVSSSHEALSDSLDRYLISRTVDDLFERVLERVEGDCGGVQVTSAMTALWASRAGLAEQELLDLTGLVPATWSPIRMALDDALVEVGGRITFAHDYLRIAVSDRYLAGNGELADEGQDEEALGRRRTAHERLAHWLEEQPVDARIAEELPWQWRAARNWDRLRACLTDRDVFEAMSLDRPEEEILTYWLDLGNTEKADISECYEAALASWGKIDDPIREINIYRMVFHFLHFAGYADSFTERVARRWIKLCETTLGPADPQTAQAINDLAVILDFRGQRVEAGALYTKAAELRQHFLGEDHIDTAESYHNLAGFLDFEGDAEAFYTKALQIRRLRLGELHPQTIETKRNLAAYYDLDGRTAEAEKIFRDCLRIAQDADGPKSLLSAESELFLSIFLWRNRRVADAQRHAERGLEISIEILGPHHPRVCAGIANLASVHKLLGNVQEATTLLKRQLEMLEQAPGPLHPDTVDARDELVDFLIETGQPAEAVPLLQQKLTYEEKELGAAKPEIATTLLRLGGALAKANDEEGAEHYMRRALSLTGSDSGTSSAAYCECLQTLADLMAGQNRWGEGAELLAQVLLILQTTDPTGSDSIGQCHLDLGIHLVNADRIKDGEEELRKANAIFEDKAPQCVDRAIALEFLGRISASEGKTREARAFFLRSLAIQEMQSDAEKVAELYALINDLEKEHFMSLKDLLIATMKEWDWEDDVETNESEDVHTVATPYNIDGNEYRMFLEAHDAPQLLKLYLYSPLSITSKRKADACVVINRLNKAVYSGYLDLAGDSVRYIHVVDVEGCQPEVRLVTNMRIAAGNAFRPQITQAIGALAFTKFPAAEIIAQFEAPDEEETGGIPDEL